MERTTDTVIAGAGIAGSKKPPSISNSFLAQGGIAAAIGKDDDPQLHYSDTVKAGRGLCIEKNVRVLVEEGLERVLLTKEGGHSKRRVLHVKDKTGSAIGEVFYNLVKDRVNFLLNYYLEEILTDENRYVGIVVSNGTDKILIRSKSLVIATGGYSPIYLRNTSAYKISGDTIGAAYRAGCVLKDVEFVQFHPTALFTRAIFKKYAQGEKVFLDLRPLKEKGISIKDRFPTVYNLIKSFGFSETDLIPVSPAAHYSIGGIQATANGKTSVEGIFAVGESSCTGIHGANRLASNSLLECITFGYKTAYSVYLYNMYSKISEVNISSKGIGTKSISREERKDYLLKLKKVMWDYVGLERSGEGLKKALLEIENMEEGLLVYKNSRYLIDLVYLSKGIILSAKTRKESRGTHYRTDFPEEKNDYKKHTKIYNDFKIKLEVN